MQIHTTGSCLWEPFTLAQPRSPLTKVACTLKHWHWNIISCTLKWILSPHSYEMPFTLPLYTPFPPSPHINKGMGGGGRIFKFNVRNFFCMRIHMGGHQFIVSSKGLLRGVYTEFWLWGNRPHTKPSTKLTHPCCHYAWSCLTVAFKSGALAVRYRLPWGWLEGSQSYMALMLRQRSDHGSVCSLYRCG